MIKKKSPLFKAKISIFTKNNKESDNVCGKGRGGGGGTGEGGGGGNIPALPPGGKFSSPLIATP